MERSSAAPIPEILTVASGSLDRRTVDSVLWWIHEALTAESGDDFFRALMTNLCTVYGMKYAFITRCLDQPVTQVRSLAYWSVDHLRENKAFALAGLPCEDMVCERRMLWIPEGLATQYVSKKDWGCEGYCGLPLLAGDHHTVLGHIAFFSAQPMVRNVFEDPLFHLFTARATAELRRLAAEEEAQDRLRELSHLARLSELGEIAGLIAHELAQPLTTIAMQARAGQRMVEAAPRPDVDDELQALESIAGQAERASSLIRKIRGFARRESDDATPCDINEVVAAAGALAELEAKRHSVTLRYELAEGLAPVSVARLEIEQVVLNLARNAAEALEQSQRWPRTVVMRTSAVPDGVRVAVHDNGPGLEPAMVARLFEPFFTTKPDGLGLGLPLCRALVNKHGGVLRAEPDGEDGGACFSFVLPRAGAGKVQ